MRVPTPFFRWLLLCAIVSFCGPAFAQLPPVLTWITNSSVKLEQVIGDVDWANGSNVTSQTITRFNIEGTDVSANFPSGTNRIFIFGDTIGINVNYHAGDPAAWSTTSYGANGLLLNFYTNSDGSNVFVNPPGIDMAGDDTPNAGICISNVNYLICNTGAGTDTNSTVKHAYDFSELVTFNQTNLTFQAIRTISVRTNGGHFIYNSLHLFGTNVLMFGEGDYRASDIYLATTPSSTYLSGTGTLYFTGLTNGEPTWSTVETNAVPVVQDNPANGPSWPNDTPSIGNMSVVYSTNLGLWMMTYDGGRNTPLPNTTGIYFCSAALPWGPWSTPQLIFNSGRDGAAGVFIHDNQYNPPGLIGPTIDPSEHNPTNTDGAAYAPDMIEPFTTISNSTVNIYYLMATWNPYTIVKMRSSFAIQPVIDLDSLSKLKKKLSFAWNGPTNVIYQVDYSTNPLSTWTTFTNLVASTNGTFNFTDDGQNSGGFGTNKFYRVHAPQ